MKEIDQKTSFTSQRDSKKALRLRRCQVLAGVFVLLLFPVLSFILFEYVTGSLSFIKSERILWNILWIAMIYLSVLIVTGSTRITVPVVSILIFILSLAEAFVMEFRNQPIVVWDILAFRTAMTVAGNYHFAISRPMKIAALLLCGANLLMWFLPVRFRGWKKRLAFGVSGAAVLIGVISYFYYSLIARDGWRIINMWNLSETYRENGYFFTSALSMQYLIVQSPSGYSIQHIQEIYRDIDAAGSDDAISQEDPQNIQPTNIICIMNESLSDLKIAGDFTTNEEYFPFIDSLEKNTVKGNLFVPVFGGTTANTEFEFLTSDTIHITPPGAVPFQIYVKPNTNSLVSTLKKQGYTAIGIHPYPRTNWNRDKCYNNLGFDAFFDSDYFSGSESLRHFVTDKADFDFVIQTVENKPSPDQKLFIFNVTIQNHGGYASFEDCEKTIYLTGDLEDKYPQTDLYLSLMKRSDEAFEYLIDYFSQCEQPTMIVMFGDHQPSVEDAFYDDILGKPSSEAALEERVVWYQTPFIIWTNYEQPSCHVDRLGTIYLAPLMLKLANLQMTPYNQYLLEMAQEVPAVQASYGCIDKNGVFYSWDDITSDSSPYSTLMNDYLYMTYNHIMDRQTYTPLFTLNGSE